MKPITGQARRVASAIAGITAVLMGGSSLDWSATRASPPQVLVNQNAASQDPAMGSQGPEIDDPMADVAILSPVDYRNDEPTRLRSAGLLRGALLPPQPTWAAGPGCTFDIECEDGDPCTIDTCDILPCDPPGSGICVHVAVPDGGVGACDDGLYCNGREHCDTGACVAGPAVVCLPTEYCDERLDACHDDCNIVPGSCDDGFFCNGVETCNAGTGECLAGTPPCGIDADCDEDANACRFGRCCSIAATPVCSLRRLATCSPPSQWYAGDDGQIPVEGNCPECPGCPAYSAGIVHVGTVASRDFTRMAGPVSMSALIVAPPAGPGTPLNRLGDDYSLSHGQHSIWLLPRCESTGI